MRKLCAFRVKGAFSFFFPINLVFCYWFFISLLMTTSFNCSLSLSLSNRKSMSAFPSILFLYILWLVLFWLFQILSWCFLYGSTAFLIGPKRQVTMMLDPVRIYATALYLASIIIALFCALYVSHTVVFFLPFSFI